MATLKDVQTKISAVKKTRQITKAMNMVAASRLRGAQQKMNGFKPYALKFSEVLGSLARKADQNTGSLLVPRDEVNRVHIVLCTSDRGLCGGFNLNLIDQAKTLVDENRARGAAVSMTCFGKKGRDWCRKEKLPIEAEHIGVVGANFGFSVASTSGRQLIDSYLNRVYDEVYLVYANFVSVGRQTPLAKQILPIPPIESVEDEPADGSPYMAEHICEPSPEELLEELLPKNVYVQIYSALLETSTSEHAARMTAMDNATKACNDMIDDLTLAYNKARQAAITAELMDIVGGAEALKG